MAVQVVAAALMLWARFTFGGRSFRAGANPTEGGLVTTGPYRFVRHPIYTAVLLFLWAGVASHGTIVSVLTAIVATAAVAVRVAAAHAGAQTGCPTKCHDESREEKMRLCALRFRKWHA